MYISINGSIIEEKQSRISPNSEGFLFGYGAFETIKFSQDKIYFLKEHFQRLAKACEELLISLDYDYQEVETYSKELIKKSQMKNGVLKILYAKNKESNYLLLTLRENNYNEEVYRRGFRVGFTNIRRNPYSLLTYIKSNNYMENLLVRNKGLKDGYDEIIFENVHKNLCEGTISNLFFVKEKEIYTPKTECGLLAGIMRQQVIEVIKREGINIHIGEYTKEDLLEADEIFLTNSLMVIMPVAQLENKKLNLGENKITKKLMSVLKAHID